MVVSSVCGAGSSSSSSVVERGVSNSTRSCSSRECSRESGMERRGWRSRTALGLEEVSGAVGGGGTAAAAAALLCCDSCCT
jgi:hypothetical protein